MYRQVILEGDYNSWNSRSIKKPTISTCDLCSKLRTNWQGKTLPGRCRKAIYQWIPDWRKGQRRIQHPQEQVLTRMPQQVSITYSTISHFPESLQHAQTNVTLIISATSKQSITVISATSDLKYQSKVTKREHRAWKALAYSNSNTPNPLDAFLNEIPLLSFTSPPTWVEMSSVYIT